MSAASKRLFPIYVRKGRGPRSSHAGYIDRTGLVVVEPKYEFAYPWREGLGTVLVNEKWGAINGQGELAYL